MRLSLVVILFLVHFTSWAHRHDEDSLTFYFTPNQGQFEQNTHYRSNIPGGLLFLENNKFTYHFYDVGLLTQLHLGEYKGDTSNIPMRFHAYQMEFIGANSSPTIQGKEKLHFFENYYLGNNSNYWAEKVPTYEKVYYTDLYPGVDLQIYSDVTALKYDLIVKKGANANQIEWKYEGLDNLKLRLGKLQLTTSLGETIEDKPLAYQVINGKKKKVSCKYVLTGNRIKFEFPNGYDRNYDLIIDPILVFSTYSGATSSNFGYSATYDAYGHLYSASSAFGIGYPTTLGAYQLTWAGGFGGTSQGIPSITGTDIAITKWDTNGSQPLYSTYLGGTKDELPHSLIVNENNELYVMGTTGSEDFPVTSLAFDTTFNTSSIPFLNLLNGLGVFHPSGSDICVTKFDSSGASLLASTFIGGSHNDGLNTAVTKFNYADEVRGEILLDQLGDVVVVSCSQSMDIPMGSTTFQMTKPAGTSTSHQDGVIFKLENNLQNLLWASYLGGDNSDAIYSVAISQQNEIFVCGGTNSLTYPATNGTLNTSHIGSRDGFVAHISANGDSLIKATYYGSINSDQSYFIELDKSDNVYLYGQTSAPQGELITNAAYHDSLGGQFVTKMTSTLDSIIWETRFGNGDGDPDISPTAFLVDVCNSIYLSGWGSSVLNGTLTTNGLDTAGGAFQGTTDGQDFYLMVLADDASQLNYATYFGGSASEHVDGGTSRFDKKGKIYHAVCAGCPSATQPATSDFPTFPNPGAHSNVNGTIGAGTNSCNLAVFKMDFNLPVVIADFVSPAGGCAPFQVNFDNLSLLQSNTQFDWNFGDGNSSTQFEPTHTYNNAGTYVITLIVSDTTTCNLNDTLQKQITIGADSVYSIPNVTACFNEGVEIGIINNNNPNVEYQWNPSLYLSDSTLANPFATPPTTTTYTLFVDNGFCTDTITQTVFVDSVFADLIGDTLVCSGDAPFLLSVNHFQSGDSFYWSSSADFSDTLPNPVIDSTILVTPLDSLTTYYVQVVNNNGCIEIDSLRIRVRDLAEPLDASFTNPGIGCSPYNVTFNNTSDQWAATFYYWNFGNGQLSQNQFPTTTYNQSGTYQINLIATDSSICPQSDTFSVIIEVRSDTNYQINYAACLGQPLAIGITPDTVQGVQYNWSPGIGLNDSTIADPTTILTENQTYLQVVDGVCLDSITHNVQVEPIYAITDSLVTACSDQNNLLLIGNSNGSGTNFFWSLNSDLSNPLNNIQDSSYAYQLTDSIQTFYFGVESQGGCLESDSLTVVVTDLVLRTTSDTVMCIVDTVTIGVISSFSNLPVNYNWSPTPPIIGSTTNQIAFVKVEETTQFYVTAIDDSGCVYRDSVAVLVSELATITPTIEASPDTVIRTLGSQLILSPNNGNYSYSWTPNTNISDSTIFNPVVFPTEETWYYGTVTDNQFPSCTTTARIPIYVREIVCGEPDIFVPNAFSPDGNGENDELRVYGENIRELDLNIFNRWGEKVFESKSQDNTWKGNINGDDANNAVYMYHLKVTCVNGEEFEKKGNITLLR